VLYLEGARIYVEERKIDLYDSIALNKKLNKKKEKEWEEKRGGKRERERETEMIRLAFE